MVPAEVQPRNPPRQPSHTHAIPFVQGRVSQPVGGVGPVHPIRGVEEGDQCGPVSRGAVGFRGRVSQRDLVLYYDVPGIRRACRDIAHHLAGGVGLHLQLLNAGWDRGAHKNPEGVFVVGTNLSITGSDLLRDTGNRHGGLHYLVNTLGVGRHVVHDPVRGRPVHQGELDFIPQCDQRGGNGQQRLNGERDRGLSAHAIVVIGRAVPVYHIDLVWPLHSKGRYRHVVGFREGVVGAHIRKQQVHVDAGGPYTVGHVDDVAVGVAASVKICGGHRSVLETLAPHGYGRVPVVRRIADMQRQWGGERGHHARRFLADGEVIGPALRGVGEPRADGENHCNRRA